MHMHHTTFIPFCTWGTFSNKLSPWNPTPKPANMRSWYLRKILAQVPNLESILDRVPQSCSLLPFGCGIRKTTHNTKHCGGLALSSFVWCLPHGSHSPTVPSFPSAKIGPALGGQLRGFCMGDYCVWDGATNLLESLFIIMGPRT